MKRHVSNFVALSEGRPDSRLKLNGSLMLAMSACTLLSASPVYAEDIEIYISPAPESGGANVLILVDNSGSTNSKFKGTPQSAGGKVIDEISWALQQVVGGLSGGTRVGVAAQFPGGDDGGAIYYPVKQIDEKSSPVGYARVKSLQGDAFQWMKIPSAPIEVSDAGISWDVMDASADTLPMPSILSTGGAENVVTFQLEGLMVPRYAQVDKAIMTLRTPTADAGATTNFRLRIAHELTSTPTGYSATDDAPVRDWSVRFDNSPFSPDPTNPNDTGYNAKGTLDDGVITLDVTEVVQNAVRTPYWCGGGTLSLMIQGTDIPVASVPEIYSVRAVDAVAGPLGVTELNVNWNPAGMASPIGTPSGDAARSCMGGLTVALAAKADDATETTDGKNLQTAEAQLLLNEVTTGAKSSRGTYIAGARFAGVGFPAGTTVGRALLKGRFTSVAGTSPAVTISPMLGDTPAFSAGGAISGRSLGSNSVVVPAAVGDFSVDIKDLVNEIFADAGWAANSALGLRFDRKSGTAVGIHALDNGDASGLVLTLDVLSDKPSDFVSSFSRRADIQAAIDTLSDGAGGGKNKPVGSYIEGGLYMLGEEAEYGEDVSHVEAFTADKSRYLSPTEVYDECGGNHIIMVTNADSTGEDYQSQANDMIGKALCPSNSNGDAWYCAEQVAAYLNNGAENSSGIPITTHTISFDAAEDTVAALAAVALAGGGESRKSDNALELVDELSELINKLTTTDASMAAPGVAVNQLNRFQHLDELYYALFRPALNTYWEGNLKRYKLDFALDPPQIVDQKGTPAVDPETGFFRDTTNSWWGTRADGTDADDGQRVDSGGAREELAFRTDPRKLLVTVPGSSTLRLVDAVEDITPAQIGLDAAIYPDPAVLKAEMQDRLDMLLLEGWADPLHTEPRLVNYGFTGDIADAAMDTSLQDNTVFVSTNGGMLHAIDPKNGNELFSIMPAEELSKTEKRYQSEALNAADPKRSTYGLDGGITVWRRGGADGKPDHVYLYAGQRRGGRSYYALDVTDRSAPSLLWQINGGSGDFASLAQTWSQPTFAQIMSSGVKTPVLVFGGGYSGADHDDAATFSSTGDAAGNAIFIVNAKTGALIKRFSSGDNADMKWSIVSSISVVDVDFNGTADFLYAADLAGQVFRVDLDRAPDTTDSLATARVATVAKLGRAAAGGAESQRRFYSAPTIALSRRGGENVLQVLVGSGYRSHPLDTVAQDRFYALDDVDALEAPATLSSALTASDLSDITDGGTYDETSKGWLYRLTEPGEKVLSNAVVMEGAVYFTTFLPESRNVNKCQRVIGASRLYGLSLLEGAPAIDFDNDGNFDPFRELILPGLPPMPQLLLGPEGEQVLLTGTAATDIGEAAGLGLRRTRWYQVPNRSAADAVLDKAINGQ